MFIYTILINFIYFLIDLMDNFYNLVNILINFIYFLIDLMDNFYNLVNIH